MSQGPGDAATISKRDTARARLVEGVLSVLVAAIVALALLKATTPGVAFPGWDLDPAVFPGPVIGLGPTATFGVDVTIVTLSGAVLALAGAAGATVAWWRWVLLAFGLGMAVWHGWLSPTAAQGHLTLGASWAGAIAACVAISCAARFAGIARLVAAMLLGSIAFFALKAGVQVLIENPQTIEMFKANRKAMLAAQGWTPDSFPAKAFERRLFDAPGTGWVGLSNVLATAGACSTVGTAALMLGTRRLGLGPVLAFLAGVSVLVVASSKGGWAAAAIGLGLLAAWPTVLSRMSRPGVVLVAVPILALAAIALRGAIGERVGELSLLFRAQYLSAALRIIAEHPLTGVGPAGFKDAYLLAKSPLNPEEVSSPHSVFFDFTATLGVGGIAWSLLLISFVAAAGRACCSQPPAADQPGPRRSEMRLLLLALAAVTIAGSWVELEISSPANVLIRMGGLALAAVIGIGVIGIDPIGVPRLAVALAACVGLTHAMVEVTPVLPGSCVLLACLVGLAGASAPWHPAPARFALARGAPGLTLCLVGALASAALPGLSRWESLLRAGAESMARASAFSRALGEAADRLQHGAVLADIATALGEPVEADEESVRSALRTLRFRGAEAALQNLVAAIAVSPTDAATRESASRLALQLAQLHEPHSDGRRDLRHRAIQIAADASRLPLRRAASQAWLANVLRGAADLGGDPTLRREALQAWEQAAALDPWNPLHPAAAAKLAAELQDLPKASAWAKKALILDSNMRLDPLRQFEEAERRALENISRAGG